MTTKINAISSPVTVPLAPLPDHPQTLAPSQNTGSTTTQPGESASRSVDPLAPEALITETESSRQSTQNNATASKLLGETNNIPSQSLAPPPTRPLSAEAVVEKAAKTPATPFEEIPAQFLTADEARAELLALEKHGDIDVEFTEEGKTVLFVPVFDVNFKKEATTDQGSSEVPVKSFLFPQPQEAVSISRLSEWASLKGISDILFRGFSAAKTAAEEKIADIFSDKTPAPAKTSQPTSSIQEPSTQPSLPAVIPGTTSSPTPLAQTPATTTTVPLATQAPATTSAQTLQNAGSPTLATQTSVSKSPLAASGPLPALPTTTTVASLLTSGGIPKPSSPPPHLAELTSKPSTEPVVSSNAQAIPLSQLHKDISLSSSSAVPIQKSTGIAKPSIPHPSTQDISPSQTTPANSLQQTQPVATALPQQPATTISPKVTTQANEPLAAKATQTTTTPQQQVSTNASTSAATPLSSLGERLQSLIKSDAPPVSNLGTSSSSLSELLKDRVPVNLLQMDIAGFRGTDPNTGKVIDTHGYRDMIRFNHNSYLQSVQSARAEVARETQQREAQERENLAKAQRHTEQQELRMLLELEQLRRLNTIQAPGTLSPAQPSTTPSSTSAHPELNPTAVPQDTSIQRLQHQWNEQLKHKDSP